MTFQTVVETIAGHDLNHLAQLRLIAELTCLKADFPRRPVRKSRDQSENCRGP